MNPIVATLWWTGLLATLVAFLPNLVAWLSRALSAAHRIERYTSEILGSTEGIATNTARAQALKNTLAITPQLVARAESMERHAGEIETATAARGKRGTSTRGETRP